MTFQVRTFIFEKEVPSVEIISDVVRENTSQEIISSNSNNDFKDHYLINFVQFPDDTLTLRIVKNEVAIIGDFYRAPALREVLSSILIFLGGKSTENIELLELPISDKVISDLDTKARKDENSIHLYIRLSKLVGILLILGTIYFLFSLFI